MIISKKLLAGVLCGLLAVSLSLAGCTKKGAEIAAGNGGGTYEMDPNLNPPGSLPICKEPVTLRILMPQSPTISDIATNKYTKKIEEYGNVKLEFEMVPSADVSTKINLIMNSKGENLPDIINSVLSGSQIATFGANGMIVPLNEYYENSSYYIKQGLERIDPNEFFKYITAADGNIYSVPRYNKVIQNEFMSLMWIYKPWLDQLGLEVPQTLEEYKAALIAFRDNDMNGNGDKTDEIPLVDYTGYNAVHTLLNAFITFTAGSGEYLSAENGKLRFAFADERWKEGLKYLGGLCREGLFSPVSFTMDQQQFKTVLANESNKAGSFAWTSTSCLPGTSARRGEFVAMSLKGDSGKNSIHYTLDPPEERWFITKNCKNPEVAFRIADLMCSDELTLWSRFGEEGVDWVQPPEGEPCLYDFLGYKALIKPILQWGSIQNSHWNNVTPGFRTYEIGAGMVVGEDMSQIAKANAIRDLKLMEKIPKEPVTKLAYNQDEIEEFSDITVVMKTLVTEKIAQFITGNEDIDANWDGYISQLKNMGLDRALEIAQTAYDRMNASK